MKYKLFELQLFYLIEEYNKWETNHSENLNLFEIIEYGRFEPIHTKFFYWLLRPRYHTHSYRDKYIREFLKKIGVEPNDNTEIIVHSEECSSNKTDEEEKHRRSDIWIELKNKNSTKNVIIENKIDDDLTVSQVKDEVKQYLKNEGDVFVAMILDSNIYQFENILKNDEIKELKQKYKFEKFIYSEWLKLNEDFQNHFSKNEKEKVQHLNENIKKVIKMEMTKFDEECNTYLDAYKAIKHFKEKYIRDMDNFTEKLWERIKKEFKLQDTDRQTYKRQLDNHGLRFKFNGHDVFINLKGEGLGEHKCAYLDVFPNKDNAKLEDVLKKIDDYGGWNGKENIFFELHLILKGEVEPVIVKILEKLDEIDKALKKL